MIDIRKFSVNNYYNDVNLTINDGKIIGLVGANGSGKSLLLKYILGILNNYEGEILINGEILTDDNYISLREYVGVLMQNPYNQFIGETVIDEITFKLEQNDINNDEITKILDDTKYSKEFLDKKLSVLSGGQAQKLLLDSNISLGENNVILDETLSNMDISLKEELLN